MNKIEQDERLLGVGVIIIKNKKILMGHRLTNYEDPCWAFPGGKVESRETIMEAAIREAKEEADIEIANIRPVTFFDDVLKGRHILSFIVQADIVSGDPKIMEPEKCTEWKWFTLEEIPENLTPNNKKLLAQGVFQRLLGNGQISSR